MNRLRFTYKLFYTETNEIISEGYFERDNSPRDVSLPKDVQFPNVPSFSTYTIASLDTEEVETFIIKKKLDELPKFNFGNVSNTYVQRSWGDIDRWLERSCSHYKQTLAEILNPDFQRGHVWEEEDQISYLEYVLKDGQDGKNIYFNETEEGLVCVDGLQRLTAVNKFREDKFKVFGEYYFSDLHNIDFMMESFSIKTLRFKTKEEVIDWYIYKNASGKAHTAEELRRVLDLRDSL